MCHFFIYRKIAKVKPTSNISPLHYWPKVKSFHNLEYNFCSLYLAKIQTLYAINIKKNFNENYSYFIFFLNKFAVSTDAMSKLNFNDYNV